MKKLFISLLALVFIVSASYRADAEITKTPVVFHFTTVGDCRGDPLLAGATEQDLLWVQSTKVLARMIREMQIEKPQALFYNGDMIYGYSSNKEKMERYYAYWRGMMANLIESGTYFVPIPGNHEVQIKIKNQITHVGTPDILIFNYGCFFLLPLCIFYLNLDLVISRNRNNIGA